MTLMAMVTMMSGCDGLPNDGDGGCGLVDGDYLRIVDNWCIDGDESGRF